MRSAIVVCAGIASRSNEQNIVLVRLAYHVSERARALRRTPARADDANVHARLLPLDDVIDRFNRILRRPKTAGVQELQRHDLDFPVHARDAEVVLTFSAD